MIYELECPTCFRVEWMESDSTVLDWFCEGCKMHPVISLPTDEDGNLIDGDN